jgi:PPOX class probable F420-dependent enzyme
LYHQLTKDAAQKLATSSNIWMTTVRPDGRPHMAPIWFVWFDERIFVSTDSMSVKARNIKTNFRVALALEDGDHPVILEGTARAIAAPYPPDLIAAFLQKYDWDLASESADSLVIEISPNTWLIW